MSQPRPVVPMPLDATGAVQPPAMSVSLDATGRALPYAVPAPRPRATRAPESPRASAGVFAPPHRALTVGILLSITAVACEGMAVATVMPSVALDLGGLEAYGWAFSAFMLASLIGAIGAGQAADRRGVTVPAALGFALFAFGLVLSGSALAWPLLLLGRAVQGFGAGALGSAAYVVVARGYPEQLRPRLMALLSSAWIVPSLLGPAVAGQVAEHASWRLVFVGLLPPVAVGAWMLLPALRRLPAPAASDAPDAPDAFAPGDGSDGAPRTRLSPAVDDRRGSPDAYDRPATPRVREPAGAEQGARRMGASLRLAVGIGLVLLAAGLDQLPLALIVGAIGVVLAVPALRALLPSGTFRASPGMPAAVALRSLLAFAFFGSEALIPLGLSTQRGMPPSVVGLALTAGALAWVAASWLQDRAETAARGSLAQRALRVLMGLLLIAAGIAVAAVATVNPALPVELVVLAWAVSGLGMGLTYPACTLTALGLAPRGQEGMAAASLQVAETVGIATGTGAAGAFVAFTVRVQHPMSDGLAWAFLLGLAAMLVALAPAVRLAPSIDWLTAWRPKPSS